MQSVVSASHLEHRLEPLDLILELAQHGVLGVLIDTRLVLNVLGTVGVPSWRGKIIDQREMMSSVPHVDTVS